MVKINVLVTDNDGKKLDEKEFTGETLYFILIDEIEEDENSLRFSGASGFCGRNIPKHLIADSWCNEIVRILDNQCKHNKLEVSFQLIRLAEMLNNKAHEMLDEWKEKEITISTGHIPKSLIDFLTKD